MARSDPKVKFRGSGVVSRVTSRRNDIIRLIESDCVAEKGHKYQCSKMNSCELMSIGAQPVGNTRKLDEILYESIRWAAPNRACVARLPQGACGQRAHPHPAAGGRLRAGADLRGRRRGGGQHLRLYRF